MAALPKMTEKQEHKFIRFVIVFLIVTFLVLAADSYFLLRYIIFKN